MAQDTDIPASATEQAAHWWVTLHGERASEADHREFGEWVAGSPERVEAYLRIARVHQSLKPGHVSWPTDSAEELIRAARQSPEEPATLASTQVLRAKHQRKSFAAAPLKWGLAATVALATGAAWFMLDRPQQFQTALGEQRSVELTDGSRVTLNTASKIQVRLGKRQRQIDLIQGEALFDVAHDPSRPFEVDAGITVLRAVGTQFDVDKRPDRTTVTVVEGLVAITAAGTRSAAALPTLAANDRLIVTNVGPPVLERGTNISIATAWTQRQLIFEQRPLGEVAEEFNRYNRGRIEIADTRLRHEPITGVFRTDDAESFLSFLSSIPGVLVRPDRNGGHRVALHDDDPGT